MNRQLGAPAANASGRSSLDLLCLNCGYMLRGLSIDGKCPECGLAIADSLIPLGKRLRIAKALRLQAIGYFFLMAPVIGVVIKIITQGIAAYELRFHGELHLAGASQRQVRWLWHLWCTQTPITIVGMLFIWFGPSRTVVRILPELVFIALCIEALMFLLTWDLSRWFIQLLHHVPLATSLRAILILSVVTWMALAVIAFYAISQGHWEILLGLGFCGQGFLWFLMAATLLDLARELEKPPPESNS